MVDHPFTDVIEWKGMGAILMSKDPTMTTPQINLTLVGEQNVSIWDQKIRPKNETLNKFSFDPQKKKRGKSRSQ